MAAKNRKRNRSTAQSVTTGTTIRIETPQSARQPKTPVAKVIVQEVNPVSGFVSFLREHAIVGLSIGFILGTQMATFVKVLVQNFIDPLTQLFFGSKLSTRSFMLHFRNHQAVFGWGNVLYNLIIIIFLLIKTKLNIKLIAL